MTHKTIQKAVILVSLTLWLVQPASAEPGNPEGFFSISSIFNLLVLACSIICLLWAVKILSLVKGGLMSRAWQMFVLGFVCLVLSQVMVLGGRANIVPLPGYIATLLYFGMAGTWLVGLYQTRKVLG